MTTHRRAIVFDFDGTVSLGDGPVARYAQHVSDTLAPEARDQFAASLAARLPGLDDTEARHGFAAPLAERLPVLDDTETRDGFAASLAERLPGLGDTDDTVDGYALVRDVALAHGVSDSDLSAAFLASRAELATDLAPIAAPDGLADFLRAADGTALRVLATNSPAVRIGEALEVLGLGGLFDLVLTGVGKPAGMNRVLDQVDPGDAAGAAHDRLLSVGDIWANDLAPAAARGFATAFIGREQRLPAGAQPDFVAEHAADLFAPLTAWLHGDETLGGASITAGVSATTATAAHASAAASTGPTTSPLFSSSHPHHGK